MSIDNDLDTSGETTVGLKDKEVIIRFRFKDSYEAMLAFDKVMYDVAQGGACISFWGAKERAE